MSTAKENIYFKTIIFLITMKYTRYSKKKKYSPNYMVLTLRFHVFQMFRFPNCMGV